SRPRHGAPGYRRGAAGPRSHRRHPPAAVLPADGRRHRSGPARTGRGHGRAAGYSMGGGVALQLAMSRPGMVRRLVFAGGTSYRRDGLYPEMLAEPGPVPEDLNGSSWHQAYLRVAPHPGAWTTLVAKVLELDRTFEGWPPEAIRAMTAPALLIIGDSDIVRPEHTMEMFRLIGGGVIGDIAGLPASQLAVLPGTSHVGLLERTDWLQSMILEFLDAPEPRRQ